MASTILVPGLTADDKVPGRYTSLSYGVGRRGVGGNPVILTVVGGMREAQLAENTAVTQTGSGPTVTLSGTPLLDGEYVITISLGGSNGTATFGVTRNGSSIASGVTVPTTPFTYVIPGGSGVTATFGNGVHVLNTTHAWTSSAATTYGTASAATVYDVYDIDSAAALFGAGSELYRMCKAALAVDGVSLKAQPTAWAGGAAKASLSVTVGGSWTSGGDPAIRIGGKTYRVTANVGDSTSAIATRFEDAINADTEAPVTADADAAVLYLTCKTAGARGNYWSCWKDLSLAQSGLTLTLSGGSSLTGGGVYFSGGTGADDVTACLAATLPAPAPLYNFYAYAQNDAVNMALVETQLDTKAGPFVAKYEQAVFSANGTQAAAIALSQTTLNHVFSQLILNEQGEAHPSEVAASFAAIRAITEGSNPNPNYSGTVLPGLPGRSKAAEAAEPGHSQLKAQLNAGITPTVTVDGKLKVVRAITTKCLTGALPDYRTLDLGQATVPMRMAREVEAEWDEYVTLNPYAGPDPDVANGERDAPEKVATPSLWNAKVSVLLNRADRNLWITNVAANQPISEWDADAERIMSAIPIDVRPLNNQLGVNVRQVG